MGRYYWGDIEGKFWFAVQNSDAADQFGAIGIYNQEEGVLEYSFCEKHIPKVKRKLKQLEKRLGNYIEGFNNFFTKHTGYNDEMLRKEINNDAPYYLSGYADYLLGKKIFECLKEQGECFFDAEC